MISQRIGFILLITLFILSGSITPVQAEQDNKPPQLVSQSVTPQVVAFKGGGAPGALTINLETNEPTRGYIKVIGNGVETKFHLSNEFKTDHHVKKAPWNSSESKPLPEGEYSLKLYLQDEALNQMHGYSLGTFQVADTQTSSSLIYDIMASPQPISPKYKQTEPLTTIKFNASRPAKAKVVIKRNKDGQTYFESGFFTVKDGTGEFEWNGRDNEGRIVPNGKYTITIKAKDLTYGDAPVESYSRDNFSVLAVENGDHDIPQDRLKEILTEHPLEQSTINRNDDQKNEISGTFTLHEDVNVTAWIENGANVHIKRLGTFSGKGKHSFAWDGTEFMRGSVIDGPYYVSYYIDEGPARGELHSDNELRVEGGIDVTVPKDAQVVKINTENPDFSAFYDQDYHGARKGERFPIIEYVEGRQAYKTLISEGAVGYIAPEHVDLLNVDSIPEKWGEATQKVTAYRGPNHGVKYGTFEKGKTFRILRHDGVYYRVELNTGEQVYIHENGMKEIEKPKETSTYVVKSGDVLWKIAQMYDVTVDQIVKENNLDPNDYLKIGQTLTIPTSKKPIPFNPDEKNGEYVVKSGDTLWKIASKLNTTIDQLIKLNQLDTNEYLMIGQTLKYPTSKTVHMVEGGDTLWKISQKYDVPLDNLIQINDLDPSEYLYYGQKLIIPQGKPVDGDYYTVQSGDTWWKIAKAHKTTVTMLLEANDATGDQVIYPGQQIVLP
ncbi:LysM peptidoglycan-binding domain-containing protein [Pontibacillus marinus]|uniref:LysM peptidoglycan-binding domain-containing protein n=1 Tax=Pontibacillus marinus BH030004 = DSM 16465 TaxID=1385511 RepID=A0A0A5GKU8_9BACI|nr:LysM peptidoglycan-binding domain-containing protein [Pontibacillus marinus]KGX91848.1 hypothetical protein N783_00090 [Pontibacillus marinus BH030004 = DSM 16465]